MWAIFETACIFRIVVGTADTNPFSPLSRRRRVFRPLSWVIWINPEQEAVYQTIVRLFKISLAGGCFIFTMGCDGIRWRAMEIPDRFKLPTDGFKDHRRIVSCLPYGLKLQSSCSSFF